MLSFISLTSSYHQGRAQFAAVVAVLLSICASAIPFGALAVDCSNECRNKTWENSGGTAFVDDWNGFAYSPFLPQLNFLTAKNDGTIDDANFNYDQWYIGTDPLCELENGLNQEGEKAIVPTEYIGRYNVQFECSLYSN